MAWNEPGGNKPKDPWGGGDQGPPDLDEAFKKFRDKLNTLFGGKSGGGKSGLHISGSLLVSLLVGVVVIFAALGFYQVDQQERAVVLRLGKYLETVNPGLHWNWPLVDQFFKVNVTKVQSLNVNSVMLTEDENIVEIAISVQYRVVDPQKYILRVRSPETSLDEATESALRHVVGAAQMGQIITEGREQIAVDVQERLQQYLDVYQTGFQVAKVNIEDAKAPSQVQEAFDDVTRAKEDRERLKNEAEAYANGVIPDARGRAQRQIEEANAYREQVVSRAEGEASRFEQLDVEYRKAPEVTRQRLYIDAVQKVLSNTSKVLVDSTSGNNVLYLPLDKLAGLAQESDRAASTGTPEVQVEAVPSVRRDAPLQGREGR